MAILHTQIVFGPLLRHLVTVAPTADFDDLARLETLVWLRSAQNEHAKSFTRASNTVELLDLEIRLLRTRIDGQQ